MHIAHSTKRLAALSGHLLDRLRAFLGNEDGASIVLIGLTMPALIGSVGLAVEAGYWRLHHNTMQTAADAAVLAAATNNTAGYASEGKAVAEQYGFTNGAGQVSVSVTNPATAPGCSANCYTVTISDNVPLFLSQVVGYQGTTSVNNQRLTTISATAVATTTAAYAYCVLALAGSGKQGINANGAPSAALNGCNTMSNSGATCNGHNLGADVGDAHGTNNGCGTVQNSNVPQASDAFASLASNLPANSCGGTYPQEPVKKNDPPLPASNQWNGNYSSSGVKIVCGDQQLTGNVTLSNTLLVIENGQLDTNGFTFSGSNLTIAFSGTNSGSYQHIPTGGGTLDIAAPTSGTWSGVAIYQDPALTNGVDMSAAGSTPTWDISGLAYLPNSSVTLSGAVSKSSTGQSCFELVVDNVTINGTGSIFQNDTQCAAAGLNQTKGGSRGTLVN
jgi:Flp pilus assembly protein TadG